MDSTSTWIFGYGSLLWKTDFPYVEKVIGYVKDFERKFWQGSTDHRGIPEQPGRVVTLIEKPGGLVWGAAYKLPCDERDKVMRHLDHREKGGYKTITTKFHPRDKNLAEIDLMIYIGTPDNPHFVGPEPLHQISEIILRSVGPSGPNIDYLLNLAEYVRKHIPEDKDSHLFELEQMVKSRISGTEGRVQA